jgi:hypothetical protein
MPEGGCLCGAVRYRIMGKVGTAGYCHCADCRKITGSAFNIGVTVALDDFAIEGEPSSFTKRADSGRELTRHFCPRCGSPIYTSAPAHPGKVFVKAGSLDDPTLVRPVSEAWRASKVAWSDIPPGIQSFEHGSSQ